MKDDVKLENSKKEKQAARQRSAFVCHCVLDIRATGQLQRTICRMGLFAHTGVRWITLGWSSFLAGKCMWNVRQRLLTTHSNAGPQNTNIKNISGLRIYSRFRKCPSVTQPRVSDQRVWRVYLPQHLQYLINARNRQVVFIVELER